MSSDQGPVVQRAILVGELVRSRKDRELTQKQVAERLDWSQAKMIRIEGGKQSVTQTDLEAMLRLYGVDDERIGELRLLNREANQNGWWDKYRGQVSSSYLRFVGYEVGASAIRESENAVVPGLLQTREYAEIITGLFQPDPARVGPTVNLRMERRMRLGERDNPPQEVYVLDEAVIRRHIGFRTDPGIMPRQLQKLVEYAQEESIDIHVVPFSNGAYYGMLGPMQLLSFEGPLDDTVYLDVADSMVESADAVADYSERFTYLLGDALGVEESIDLIQEAAEKMLQ